MSGLIKEDYEIDLIRDGFWKRIEITNAAYNELFDEYGKKRQSNDYDEIVDEVKNVFYFKYYFDISTAIEALIRGIAFTLCEEKKFIKYYTKPHDKGKGYFISLKELETFIDFSYTKDIFYDLTEFKKMSKKILPLSKYNIWNKSFSSEEFFKNTYGTCVEQRNLFAHGLLQSNTSRPDYTQERLLYFFYLYYYFIEYYKKFVLN